MNHSRSSVCMTYENVSGSFETPSCFKNVYTCDELVSKEGRNSLVVQVLIGVCHIQTYVKKKAYSDMNLCAHTRNEVRSPEKHVFLDSQCDERFKDSDTHRGFVCSRNMKVCDSLHTTFQVSDEVDSVYYDG